MRTAQSRFRRAAVAVATALLMATSTVTAYASEVNASVVDVTAPTNSVELAPGATSPIMINLSVTGKQDGTATFEVYRDWTLTGGQFTGSNPQEFTVTPRVATDQASIFTTPGTVKVDIGQAATTNILTMGVFDITNSNSTGAKLAAGKSGTYSVTVTAPPAPADSTAPVITPTVSGTEGKNGWYTSDVTVQWSVVDDKSSITNKTGCDEVTITTDQNETDYTCTATSAGGTASETVKIKRDATPPTISWSGGPAAGGEYYFGQVLSEPTLTVDDSLSGVANKSLTGWADSVGTHIMIATASDLAGNKAQEERTYTVKPWTPKGFYQPVDMNSVINTVKAGSTVPLKFEVFTGSTELTNTTAVKSFTTQKTLPVSGATDDIENTTTGGTSLRYDTTGGQFIQNWQTPKDPGGSYTVTLTTQDGSTLTAKFKLK